MTMIAHVVSELLSRCIGDEKELLQKTASVIYVQGENWETNITICLNVLNLLMKENFILILFIEIDLISLKIII